MERYKEKIMTFCGFGDDVCKFSMCKRLRVGAIIFPVDCSAVYAIGYNGPARDLPNDSCTAETGQCGCAHAEANAIGKLNPDILRPCLIYTTTEPCPVCTPSILNMAPPIVGLIYNQKFRISSLHLFKLRKIPVIRISDLFTSEVHDDILQEWRQLGREGCRVS